MQRDLRLKRELTAMSKSPPKGISVNVNDDKLYTLEGRITGPETSPYRNGIFSLEIVIPENYPFSPPSIKFQTKVYHPNIDDSGRICLDLLKAQPKGNWRPMYTLESLLVAIRTLLEYPNPEDPLMADIAEEFISNKEEFDKNAKQHCEKYAM